MPNKPLKSLAIPFRLQGGVAVLIALLIMFAAILVLSPTSHANTLPDKSRLTPGNMLGPRPAEAPEPTPPPAVAPRVPEAAPTPNLRPRESRRIGLIIAVDDSEQMRFFNIPEVRDLFLSQFQGLNGVRWQAIVTNTSFDDDIQTIDIRDFKTGNDSNAPPQVVLDSTSANSVGQLVSSMISIENFSANSSSNLDFFRGPLRTLDLLREVAPDQLDLFIQSNDEFFAVSFSIAPSSQLAPERAAAELSSRLGNKPTLFRNIRIPESSSVARVVQMIRNRAGLEGASREN